VKYYDEDEKICEQLCKHLKKIYTLAFHNINKFVKMKPLTNEQEAQFCKADKCERCHQEFTIDNKKCKHHDHLTGEYVGAYCNSCNILFDLERNFNLIEREDCFNLFCFIR
jgi:hypothetical protein